MNDNRCVCCGNIIPEGWQVCLACAIKAVNGKGVYIDGRLIDPAENETEKDGKQE